MRGSACHSSLPGAASRSPCLGRAREYLTNPHELGQTHRFAAWIAVARAPDHGVAVGGAPQRRCRHRHRWCPRRRSTRPRNRGSTRCRSDNPHRRIDPQTRCSSALSPVTTVQWIRASVTSRPGPPYWPPPPIRSHPRRCVPRRGRYAAPETCGATRWRRPTQSALHAVIPPEEVPSMERVRVAECRRREKTRQLDGPCAFRNPAPCSAAP